MLSRTGVPSTPNSSNTGWFRPPAIACPKHPAPVNPTPAPRRSLCTILLCKTSADPRKLAGLTSSRRLRDCVYRQSKAKEPADTPVPAPITARGCLRNHPQHAYPSLLGPGSSCMQIQDACASYFNFARTRAQHQVCCYAKAPTEESLPTRRCILTPPVSHRTCRTPAAVAWVFGGYPPSDRTCPTASGEAHMPNRKYELVYVHTFR